MAAATCRPTAPCPLSQRERVRVRGFVPRPAGPLTPCPLPLGEGAMRPASDCRRGSLDHALSLCIRGRPSMDFYAVLDQVLALLRQRQRVTYRALKLQFQLDDEALEALRDELIEAQHLAADEAGKVLVWTGP